MIWTLKAPDTAKTDIQNYIISQIPSTVYKNTHSTTIANRKYNQWKKSLDISEVREVSFSQLVSEKRSTKVGTFLVDPWMWTCCQILYKYFPQTNVIIELFTAWLLLNITYYYIVAFIDICLYAHFCVQSPYLAWVWLFTVMSQYSNGFIS